MNWEQARELSMTAKAEALRLRQAAEDEPTPARREEIEAEADRHWNAYRDLWRQSDKLRGLESKLEPLTARRDAMRDAVERLEAALDQGPTSFEIENIEMAIHYAKHGRPEGHTSAASVPERLAVELPRTVPVNAEFLPIDTLDELIAWREGQRDSVTRKMQSAVESYEAMREAVAA